MTICHRLSLVRQRYRSLADYFEQTGKTQESLAVRLEVSRSYVSLLASGERQPGLRLALRIASITGVPVEALVSQQVAS